MTNPYIAYYQNQVGTGIPGFRGLRNQKGYGFLSSFFTKSIIPIFKTITSIDPKSVVRSATKLLSSPGLKAGSQVADDIARLGGEATGSLLKSLQGGSGRRHIRRKKRRARLVYKKSSVKKRKKRAGLKNKSCTKRKRKKSKIAIRKKRKYNRRKLKKQKLDFLDI